jgi:hypothetical protein
MIQLGRKERWLAIGLAAVVGGWSSFVFAVKPAIERTRTLNRVIPENERTLSDLRAKSEQYLALRTGLDGLDKQAASADGQFELPAFVETIISQLQLTRQVTSIKPHTAQIDASYTEVTVEVRLSNIVLEQLVEFLLRIGSAEHRLLVKSLDIRKSQVNPDLLDVVVHISTLKHH